VLADCSPTKSTTRRPAVHPRDRRAMVRRGPTVMISVRRGATACARQLEPRRPATGPASVLRRYGYPSSSAALEPFPRPIALPTFPGFARGFTRKPFGDLYLTHERETGDTQQRRVVRQVGRCIGRVLEAAHDAHPVGGDPQSWRNQDLHAAHDRGNVYLGGAGRETHLAEVQHCASHERETRVYRAGAQTPLRSAPPMIATIV